MWMSFAVLSFIFSHWKIMGERVGVNQSFCDVNSKKGRPFLRVDSHFFYKDSPFEPTWETWYLFTVHVDKNPVESKFYCFWIYLDHFSSIWCNWQTSLFSRERRMDFKDNMYILTFTMDIGIDKEYLGKTGQQQQICKVFW